MNALIRKTLATLAALLGALLAIGSLIAILFELQGFGDRDPRPSVPYLIALVAAFAASVGVPLLLWRALLPDTSLRLLAVTAVGATGVALLVLGLSVS